MRPDVRGAGAGRRHDRLVAVEDLDESSGQRPRLVHVAGVEVHLSAAGLLARELELDPGALEDPHRRPPDLRRERVGETRDEECVRHYRCGQPGAKAGSRRDWTPGRRPGTALNRFKHTCAVHGTSTWNRHRVR